jgi:hypothetical protein
MKITVADFFNGFFSALALKSEAAKRAFECGEHFNESLQAAYERFVNAAERQGLQPSFLIYLNALHGDSSVIEEGLGGGIRRDLISLDNPNFQKFRIIVSDDEARENLERAPGGPEIYHSLAEDFLTHFNSAQAVQP